MSMLNKLIKVIFPYIFKFLNWPRFRANICRFSPGQIRLGKGSIVSSGSIIILDKDANLIIGENCYIGEYCNIRCDKLIEIGNGTHIAQFVTIVDADYKFGNEINFKKRNKLPVKIESNSFIGAHSCILRGSYIKKNSIIEAMSKIKR